MKRISYWFLSTVSAVVLLVGFDASQHGGSVVNAGLTPVTGTGVGGTTSSGSGNAGGSQTGTKTKSKGTTKKHASRTTTSTVTGAVAQTVWGPVQVQLTVSSSRVTAVQVVQYPNGSSRDSAINSYALPILIRETISSQSASIDMVSGATYTSQGYLQSLQSALDQANL